MSVPCSVLLGRTTRVVGGAHVLRESGVDVRR
jgi:hypothetical protein